MPVGWMFGERREKKIKKADDANEGRRRANRKAKVRAVLPPLVDFLSLSLFGGRTVQRQEPPPFVLTSFCFCMAGSVLQTVS